MGTYTGFFCSQQENQMGGTVPSAQLAPIPLTGIVLRRHRELCF
jgi:hypothetical protein